MKNRILIAALLVAGLTVWFGWKLARADSALRFENIPRPVFTDLKVAASQKPQLAISASGALYLLATTGDEDHQRLVLTMSHDGGDTFMPPVPISDEDASVSAHGENSPSLVQQPTAVYALWQQRKPGSPNQIMFARGPGMGHSFEKPIPITDKQQPSFNGFSTMKVAPNGDIYVVWLDGRDAAQPQGTFGVYLAKSSDKGATFSPNTRITLGACPCCRPTIAFGDNGEVFVAWRKVFAGDVRDIVVATSSDSGKTFSDPVKVADDHWVLHACPDSGPSMVTLNGRLYVAWYSEGGQAGIRLAVSEDAARSFSAPELASKGVLDPNHPQLSASEDGRLLLAFQGRSNREDQTAWSPTQIFVTSVDALGKPSLPQALPLQSKSASYPSLLSASAGRVFVAWTENSSEGQQVELCRGRLNRTE